VTSQLSTVPATIIISLDGVFEPFSFPYAHNQWVVRTLVGSGLCAKSDFRRPLKALIPEHVNLVPESVTSFSPSTSTVTTDSGNILRYDALVVATGLKIKWDAIRGLPEALTNSESGVSSIYSYDTCDKTWHEIEKLQSGRAIFTSRPASLNVRGLHRKSCGWLGIDIEGRND